MADSFNRSFAMGSNMDQQNLPLQAMQAAAKPYWFANPRNPSGQSHRTLGVQSPSRMIQKRRHVSHPRGHAANQTTFMAQQCPSRAAIVMDMAQFYNLVNKIAYRQVQIHNACYRPTGFGAPFGFPPANVIVGGPGQGAITQEQQPEKLDLSLKLGPPGNFPKTSTQGNFGN